MNNRRKVEANKIISRRSKRPKRYIRRDRMRKRRIARVVRLFYSYGTLGELREVKLPDQTIIKYYQNANNQRVAKEVNGTIVEKYLWLNQTTLLGFYDKEGNFGRFTYATDGIPKALSDNVGKGLLRGIPVDGKPKILLNTIRKGSMIEPKKDDGTAEDDIR
jgi:hypothetical protein